MHLILYTESDEMTLYSSSISLLNFKIKQMVESLSVTGRVNIHRIFSSNWIVISLFKLVWGKANIYQQIGRNYFMVCTNWKINCLWLLIYSIVIKITDLWNLMFLIFQWAFELIKVICLLLVVSILVVKYIDSFITTKKKLIMEHAILIHF